MKQKEQIKRILENIERDKTNLSDRFNELEIGEIEEFINETIDEARRTLLGYRNELDNCFHFPFVLKKLEKLERIYFLLIRIRDANNMLEEIKNGR